MNKNVIYIGTKISRKLIFKNGKIIRNGNKIIIIEFRGVTYAFRKRPS
jgi:uncharacterized protein YdgA (DUF945 family)